MACAPECHVSGHSCCSMTFSENTALAFIAKKLCPDLILVENHFHRYMELSKKVMNIFRRYDPSMCAAGCDEGYLK